MAGEPLAVFLFSNATSNPPLRCRPTRPDRPLKPTSPSPERGHYGPQTAGSRLGRLTERPGHPCHGLLPSPLYSFLMQGPDSTGVRAIFIVCCRRNSQVEVGAAACLLTASGAHDLHVPYYEWVRDLQLFKVYPNSLRSLCNSLAAPDLFEARSTRQLPDTPRSRETLCRPSVPSASSASSSARRRCQCRNADRRFILTSLQCT
jgi:hypothetical protein